MQPFGCLPNHIVGKGTLPENCAAATRQRISQPSIMIRAFLCEPIESYPLDAIDC